MAVDDPPIQERTTTNIGLFPQMWSIWFESVKSCFDNLIGRVETLENSGVTGFDSIVIVKEASDLANIDSTKTYYIDGAIDMGSQQIEVPEGGVYIYSDDINIKGLFSTANNYTMFINKAGDAYAGNIGCSNMFLVCSGTNSKIFDVDNNENFSAIEFIDVNIGNFGYGDTTEIGDITDYRQVRFIGCGFINCDDGLTFNGTMSGGIVAESSIALSLPAMTLFKEGSSLLIDGSVHSDINFLSVDSSAVLFDFQESNIVNKGAFSLKNVRTDADDIIPNIPSTSVKARFKNCEGLRNTYVGGQFQITTEAATVISTAGTFVKVAGVTTYSDLAWFTGDNDNEFVYIGNQVIEIEAKGLLSFSGGNNDQIDLMFRKWDDSASAYVDLPKTRATLNGGLLGTRAEGMGIFAYTEMSENDRLEVWVANISDTTNVSALLGGLVSIVERPS